MEAPVIVIFKHRHNHAADQMISGVGGGRQYHVDPQSLLLHPVVGRLARISAEPGVSNEADIAEFRAFPRTFAEVPAASVKPASSAQPSAPPPPASQPAAPAAPPPPAPAVGDGQAAPAAPPVAPAPPAPPAAPEHTIDSLIKLSVSDLKAALADGKADHIDFRALADAERNGQDRSTALSAILARKQTLDRAAAEAAG